MSRFEQGAARVTTGVHQIRGLTAPARQTRFDRCGVAVHFLDRGDDFLQNVLSSQQDGMMQRKDYFVDPSRVGQTVGRAKPSA